VLRVTCCVIVRSESRVASMRNVWRTRRFAKLDSSILSLSKDAGDDWRYADFRSQTTNEALPQTDELYVGRGEVGSRQKGLWLREQGEYGITDSK